MGVYLKGEIVIHHHPRKPPSHSVLWYTLVHPFHFISPLFTFCTSIPFYVSILIILSSLVLSSAKPPSSFYVHHSTYMTPNISCSLSSLILTFYTYFVFSSILFFFILTKSRNKFYIQQKTTKKQNHSTFSSLLHHLYIPVPFLFFHQPHLLLHPSISIPTSISFATSIDKNEIVLHGYTKFHFLSIQ